MRSLPPESPRGAGSRRRRGVVASLMITVTLLACGCGRSVETRLDRLFEARRQGGEALVAKALLALADPALEVRSTAAWMLGETHPVDAGERKAVVEGLLAALQDRSPNVRAAAVGALGGFASPAITERVRPLALDADPTVRLRAIGLLGVCDAEGAADLLAAATTDPDPDVRVEAVSALAGVAQSEVLPEIAAVLLTDTDWRVRSAAIPALASRQSAETLPLLRLAEVDANPLVRIEARRARLERPAAPPTGAVEVPAPVTVRPAPAHPSVPPVAGSQSRPVAAGSASAGNPSTYDASAVKEPEEQGSDEAHEPDAPPPEPPGEPGEKADDSGDGTSG